MLITIILTKKNIQMLILKYLLKYLSETYIEKVISIIQIELWLIVSQTYITQGNLGFKLDQTRINNVGFFHRHMENQMHSLGTNTMLQCINHEMINMIMHHIDIILTWWSKI